VHCEAAASERERAAAERGAAALEEAVARCVCVCVCRCRCRCCAGCGGGSRTSWGAEVVQGPAAPNYMLQAAARGMPAHEVFAPSSVLTALPYSAVCRHALSQQEAEVAIAGLHARLQEMEHALRSYQVGNCGRGCGCGGGWVR